VVVAAGGGVGNDLKPRAVYAGTPAIERGQAFETWMMTRRLKGLFRDVQSLKKTVRDLGRGGPASG